MTATEPLDVREHGTLSSYVIGKCRCTRCRTANTDYSARVDQFRRALGGSRLDAEPVRNHVQRLSARGTDPGRAARLAAVSPSTVHNLLHGALGRPPTERMQAETAARLLAVQAETVQPAAPDLVDATGTRLKMRALVARGWPQYELAARMTLEAYKLSAVLRGDAPTVPAAVARAADALYLKLREVDPASEHVERRSIAYARAAAADHGWAGPRDWDATTTDDPAAALRAAAAYRQLLIEGAAA